MVAGRGCPGGEVLVLLGKASRTRGWGLGAGGLHVLSPALWLCVPAALTGPGPASQVVYYIFAILGISLFRGVVMAPGNGR